MLVSSVQGQRLTRPPRLMCHRLSNINSKFSQNDNKAAIQKPRLSEKHKDPERHTSMVLFTCLTITSLCVQQLMRLPAKETHIDKPMFNRDYICPSCNWLPPSSTRVKTYSDSKTHNNTQHQNKNNILTLIQIFMFTNIITSFLYVLIEFQDLRRNIGSDES